jgi:lysyl-tRNA synthetase class 2
MLIKFDERIGVPDSNPSSFEEVKFYDFIQERIGEDPRLIDLPRLNSLVPENKRKKYSNTENSRGYVLHNLFEGLMKDETNRNLTILGYPRQITVLSKSSEEDPDLAEEFRMFVKGRSYCYGCTELTDFEEQGRRIKEQATFLGKSQDKLDEDFMESLKIGIPPCAGLGLSLERLLSIYLDQKNLNDVIFFPL